MHLVDRFILYKKKNITKLFLLLFPTRPSLTHKLDILPTGGGGWNYIRPGVRIKYIRIHNAAYRCQGQGRPVRWWPHLWRRTQVQETARYTKGPFRMTNYYIERHFTWHLNINYPLTQPKLLWSFEKFVTSPNVSRFFYSKGFEHLAWHSVSIFMQMFKFFISFARWLTFCKVPFSYLGWRTFLIVPELKDELNVWTSKVNEVVETPSILFQFQSNLIQFVYWSMCCRYYSKIELQ